MNQFWTKKLPALLLALTLMVGMMPAALAAETGEIPDPNPPVVDPTACTHNYVTRTSATYHWTVCSLCSDKTQDVEHTFDAGTQTTRPTCYSEGILSKSCSGCTFTTDEKMPIINHAFVMDAWEKDENQHFHLCENYAKGCLGKTDAANHSWADNVLTAATCTATGRTVRTCTICTTKTVIDTAKTPHPDTDKNNLCDVCKTLINNTYTVTFYTGTTTTSQTVTAGGKPTNPGTPSKTGSNLTYAFQGWTTASTSTYVHTGQALTDVVNTAVNGNVSYYAVYRLRATSQNLSLVLNGNSAISGNSSTTQSASMVSQLHSKFNSLTGGTLTKVQFSSPSGASYGTMYSNSGKTALSSSVYYYYNNAAFGSYPLSGMYFQPTGSQGTYSLPYTASDEQGNTVLGTLSFTVNAATSKISYTVAPGQAVAFNIADFNKAYQSVYSGSISHVTFATSHTLDNNNGAVYYNYGGSSATLFSRGNLASYRYYYNSSSYGEYPLSQMSFYAGTSTTARTITLSFRALAANGTYVDGTVEVKVSGATNKISYNVASGQAVSFNVSDFNTAYRSVYSGNISHVTFSTSHTLDNNNGAVYYNYGGSSATLFSRSNLANYRYYYNNSSYGEYPLSEMSFYAGTNTATRTITLSYRASAANGTYVDGTVEIKVSGAANKITYNVAPGQSVAFNISDFNKAYQDSYSGTLRWVTFTTANTLNNTNGTVYYNYGGRNETSFTKSTIDDYTYYYNSTSYGQYPLSELSFVAGSDFTSAVTLSYRAYGSDTSYVDGSVVIQPQTASGKGDIFYYAATGTNVQLNPNDIARFFNQKYPYDTLQYVKLSGVPGSGSLYYNYYGASKYGSSQLRLTSSNSSDVTFYFSPNATTQYSLNDLTYIPSGSNYCAAIPFTAYSSSSRNVSGTILISVSRSAVPEVYGVTPRGTAVYLPDDSIYSAVNGATGLAMSSIQLLDLPTSSAGTLYCGTSLANTSTRYGYTTGTQRISQLRYVPTSGFIGSVELPYVAYNSNGDAIASGKFCLGVVNAVRKFTDTPSSAWCFKYVTELSDANIINGYENNTFRYNNTITYGAALKLVMLASGYSVQKPTNANPFSGYLAKAKADGLVSGNVNLTKPISRLALAQIAAKAMKLDVNNLSSVKPFTDTTDPHVQALNAAGIVEGYFTSGTSTFKPGNSLTRGHVSAIVWRMDRMGS